MSDGHIASPQSERDRLAVDLELIGQLIDREAMLVGVNEIVDLIVS
jgi:hypothetical protein